MFLILEEVWRALLLTCVVVSPSVSGRGTTPLSTLMPGMMPLLFRMSANGVPSAAGWKSVSSNKICGRDSVEDCVD